MTASDPDATPPAKRGPQKTAPRRSYGTGRLFPVEDAQGRESWYGLWYSNGRRVQRKIGPARTEGGRDGLTKAQAEKKLRKMIDEIEVAPANGDRAALSELVPRYVRHLEELGRKRSTVVAIRGHFKHWFVPFFGERTLDAIRAEDVQDLMAMMRRGERPGELTRTKPLSPKTIRNTIGTLNALYRFAQRKRWATRNPIEELELPVVAASVDIRFLTRTEVLAVAQAALPGAYQAVDRAMYLTAALTGMRMGELIALRWRDVDWKVSKIRVRQSYVLGEFGTPKSRRSSRSVPMIHRLAVELARLAQGADPTGDPDPDALVFADPVHGGPLGKPQVLRRFRHALRAARLDDTHRFHDLRHTFGTHLAAQGMPMRTLQELMGHKDLATTQRYADYAPSTQEEALIQAAFGGDESQRSIQRSILSESDVISDDANGSNKPNVDPENPL